METVIRVLFWSDFLAVYTMWVMMTYLTEVWDLSVTHAAGILNIWGGIVLTLPMGLGYLVEALHGEYLILALSSIAYSIGLGFLWMSTPPVLSGSMGTCSEYKPECIGHTQKALFYAALALTALGISGHIVSLKPFIRAQNKKQSPKKRELLIVIFVVVGGIALPYIKPWSIRFGIPALCTSIATILFVIGLCCSCKTDRRRSSDTAAVKLPNQQRNSTKITISLIPICLTFIICGVVSSAGSTYFEEQANNLSRKLGILKVPLPILKMLQDYGKKLLPLLYRRIKEFFSLLEVKHYAVPVGIAGAMIFAVLSCITAAKVEARRLDVIKSHGLIEKPEDTIPMSIFWMFPQFFLLAGLDSFYEESVKDFFSAQFPESNYLEYITHGVSGLGYMASVLSVFVIGKISERGGKQNWFQHTLNKSRLDNYFWALSGICAVNLLVYLLISPFYSYKETDSNGEEKQPQNEGFDEEAQGNNLR